MFPHCIRMLHIKLTIFVLMESIMYHVHSVVGPYVCGFLSLIHNCNKTSLHYSLYMFCYEICKGKAHEFLSSHVCHQCVFLVVSSLAPFLHMMFYIHGHCEVLCLHHSGGSISYEGGKLPHSDCKHHHSHQTG